MQVTINVQGSDLAPTLQSVLDSMTVEDKRKLACDIAREYFVKKMRDESHWSRGAENYLEGLARVIRDATQAEIAADPQCKELTQQILKQVRQNFPALVHRAVLHVIAQQVGGAIGQLFTPHVDFQQLQRELSKSIPPPP